MYRLYDGPGSRLLDMFGLLGRGAGRFTEHAALDGVSLDIRRGEKVAFIGRNGAGKSTLLKLVTKVIEPTSGSLEVQGKVHALLQIGTGFHPDFTGRENVLAYLAQLGVTGRDAERKCAEIVEFAELEEYIGQPVKTYSSGMAVRLMFSTATAITPELLVLDEVLGVGDAYFAQKSYERMRELTDGAGTTLLLVTHDIYSAAKFCERIIWIDRGRVLMDGGGPEVIKAYEDSIRQQEEARLRLRKQARLRDAVAAAAVAPAPPAILEIQSESNVALPSPVYFSRIEAVSASGRHTLPLGESAFEEHRPAHLQRESTAWGEAVGWEGRAARQWRNHGSSFHKVAGTLPMTAPLEAWEIEIDYWSERPFRAPVRLFMPDRVMHLGMLEGAPGGWQTWSARLQDARVGTAAEINTSGIHGTGVISVADITPIGADGREAYHVTHGEPFELRIAYAINKPALAERAQVLIAFHRDGTQDVARAFTRELLFDRERAARGEVRVRIPSLTLGSGTYTVTVMVAREGYYDESQTRYFTLNEGVYACHTRVFEIVVTGGGAVASGTGAVLDAEWTLS